MFKIIPENLKSEGDRREQEDLEDFPTEQAEDPDPPGAKETPARLIYYVQIICWHEHRTLQETRNQKACLSLFTLL